MPKKILRLGSKDEPLYVYSPTGVIEFTSFSGTAWKRRKKLMPKGKGYPKRKGKR